MKIEMIPVVGDDGETRFVQAVDAVAPRTFVDKTVSVSMDIEDIDAESINEIAARVAARSAALEEQALQELFRNRTRPVRIVRIGHEDKKSW
jgi:hypothetical protein